MIETPGDDDQPRAGVPFHAFHGASPNNLDELVLQVQWLAHRVQVLESQLAKQQGGLAFHRLRKIDYHIGKLYVKELSGTLNIGVSSVGGDIGLGAGDTAGAQSAQSGQGNQGGHPSKSGHGGQHTADSEFFDDDW